MPELQSTLLGTVNAQSSTLSVNFGYSRDIFTVKFEPTEVKRDVVARRLITYAAKRNVTEAREQPVDESRS